jgi:hypothetical protein
MVNAKANPVREQSAKALKKWFSNSTQAKDFWSARRCLLSRAWAIDQPTSGKE